MDSGDCRLNKKEFNPRAAAFFIGIYFIEKLTNVIIIMNIILYLRGVLHQNLDRATINSNFAQGVSSIVPLLGAFVAYRCTTGGRFWMTVMSWSICFMGLCILIMTESIPTLKASQKTFVLSGLMISFGMGGMQPCLEILSTDQFDNKHPQHKNSWKFGMGIMETLGTAIFNLVLDSKGWTYTHIVLCICMLASMVIFCCGFTTYQHLISKLSDLDQNPPYHINRCMLVLIWLACMMFGLFNVQTTTLFLVQNDIKYKILIYGIQISTTTFYFVSIVGVKSFIIFLEKFVFRTTNKIPIFLRLIIGMLLALFAMATAVVVEKKRLATTFESTTERGRLFGHNPVSIFWILPQAMLLAIADTFISNGIEDFFWDHMPSSLFNFTTGFYTSASGLGSFVNTFLITLGDQITLYGQSWIDKDLNSSRIDNFYILLTAICFLCLIALVLIFLKIHCGSPDRAHALQSEVSTSPVFSVDRIWFG